jgi:plasmid stabilization system protein ParE
MKYAFHPEARAEFLAAIDYYEECAPGLGADFAIEVRSTIRNILSFPNAWPILEDDLRRSQTRRFPYGIIYAHDEFDWVQIGTRLAESLGRAAKRHE